jgi:hypothetical protein
VYYATQTVSRAISTSGPVDYAAIVSDAKASNLFEELIVAVKLLDKDSGEFVKQFLT